MDSILPAQYRVQTSDLQTTLSLEPPALSTGHSSLPAEAVCIFYFIPMSAGLILLPNPVPLFLQSNILFGNWGYLLLMF